jgi:hypothetical protein
MTDPVRKHCAKILQLWDADCDLDSAMEHLRGLIAHPEPAGEVTDDALAAFTAWFCQNYPGPDTIIHKPEWHAPKVFRAAQHALDRNSARDLGTWPSREEILALGAELDKRYDVDHSDVDLVRAALVRWGRSRRAPAQAADKKGLHGKYIIHRSRDGSPVDYPCFVLRLDGSDPAAMAAMRTYAEDPACPPELAGDLAVYCAIPASSLGAQS